MKINSFSCKDSEKNTWNIVVGENVSSSNCVDTNFYWKFSVFVNDNLIYEGYVDGYPEDKPHLEDILVEVSNHFNKVFMGIAKKCGKNEQGKYSSNTNKENGE